VKLANGVLSIKGEKQEEKEEKEKDYYRRERSFQVPEGVRRTKSWPALKMGYCR
jgi:HSP20 family protein